MWLSSLSSVVICVITCGCVCEASRFDANDKYSSPLLPFQTPGPVPAQCKNGSPWYLKGACDCPAGFTGETCLAFDCVHGMLDSESNTCSCDDGWTGVLCDLCTVDSSCSVDGVSGVCQTSLKVVQQRQYSCTDNDPILHALLKGTPAHVVVQLNRSPEDVISASFSLIRDMRNQTANRRERGVYLGAKDTRIVEPQGQQTGAHVGTGTVQYPGNRELRTDAEGVNSTVKDPQSALFGCRLTNCTEMYDPTNPDLSLMYSCHNTTCAMSCEVGTSDCSSILTGIVEKVDGNTTIRCASNGACIVNEKVLDKLFRGGVHLQCSAGECVYKHEPVPSTKPQPIPTPGPEARRQYEHSLLVVVVTLLSLTCALLAAVVAFAFVSLRRRLRSVDMTLAAKSDMRDVALFLRERGQSSGVLTWTNVSYAVKCHSTQQTQTSSTGGFCDAVCPSFLRPTQYATTLNSVNGVAMPGELTAILGPSGAGKSTLLEALAGRLRNKNKGLLEGSVRVGGKVLGANVRYMLGYVDQDDHLIRTLTPKESLMYSARLRLPDAVSDEVVTRVVEHVIKSLNMEAFADTLIGSPLRRGISGGEKRRVSIGMEMVACPGVLFLDEPTSGLDSASAQTIIQCLANVAQENDTVVLMTIHQPRSNIVNQFHRVILLSKGYNLFQGRVSEAVTFFSTMGSAACPVSYNPADYLIDCVAQHESQGESGRNHGNGPDAPDAPTRGADRTPLLGAEGQEEDDQSERYASADVAVTFDDVPSDVYNVWTVAQHYNASDHCKTVQSQIRAALRGHTGGDSETSTELDTNQPSLSTAEHAHTHTATDDTPEPTNPTTHPHPHPHPHVDTQAYTHSTNASWATQFFVLSRRTITNTLRDPQLLFGHLAVAVGVGVLLGSIYFHTGDRYDIHAHPGKTTANGEVYGGAPVAYFDVDWDRMAGAGDRSAYPRVPTAENALDPHRAEVRNNIINKFINRMGSLLLMCAFLAFGSLSSLDLFYRERLVGVHETRNGFYRQSAFYAQRLLFDFIPLRVVPPLVLGLIAYYMIGLRPGVVFLGAFLVILVLINLCATTICMLIGLLVPPSVGNLVASMVILFSLMLTPIFNNKESMPVWLSWLHYLSFFNYGYEALAVNELDGLFLSGNVYGDVSADNINSTEILIKLGLLPSSYLFDLCALTGAVALLIALGYLALRGYAK